MLRLQSSIRQNIRLGYCVIVAVIVGVTVFTLFEFKYLEKKIRFGQVISEFFDTTLEVRRFEKNYLLYKKRSDYIENTQYSAKAQELLENNLSGFRTIATTSQIARLRDDLRQYRELMEQYAGRPLRQETLQQSPLENKLRGIGKSIVTTAEDISSVERNNLRAMLSNSQCSLIISIISLTLLAIAMGQVLSRMVANPLKSLEDKMKVIAEGKFETMSIDAKDREIVSLTHAFNAMLEELKLRQQHLVQSEKLASLGTLLSGVAHELNNPLSHISSSCQTLLEEIDDADVGYKQELLCQIDEQADRARNIVRSLLDFSRERAFNKEQLILKNLFDETIRFVKGQMPTKLVMTIDIPEDVVIFADKQRVQQAFLNLIKNAMEAIVDEGEIRIKAKEHKAFQKAGGDTGIVNYHAYHGNYTLAGDTVDIVIKDTGSGIPQELLSRVFDPFFTTKDVGKGSGLGLFIVQEIVKEHDGCIAINSEIGKGTTFLIRLPVQRSGAWVMVT